MADDDGVGPDAVLLHHVVEQVQRVLAAPCCHAHLQCVWGRQGTDEVADQEGWSGLEGRLWRVGFRGQKGQGGVEHGRLEEMERVCACLRGRWVGRTLKSVL